MVFIEWTDWFSTYIKQTWDEDISNPAILVLPQAAPVADGGRLVVSVQWVLCWLHRTAFTQLMNLLGLVVLTVGFWTGSWVFGVVIGWYSVGFRLVCRQSCIKGCCLWHLAGISWVFVWFPGQSWIFGEIVIGWFSAGLRLVFSRSSINGCY